MSKSTLFTQGAKFFNNTNICKTFLIFLRFLDTHKLKILEENQARLRWMDLMRHQFSILIFLTLLCVSTSISK
jgi:hypothetical protein